MEKIVKFQGSPLTLVGRNLKLEAMAASFKVVSTDLKEVTLADFSASRGKDKIKVITSFPSLDTPVCDLELKEFKFKDSLEAKYFLDVIASIADEQSHHPSFTLIYNKVRISLTTHASGGVTDNDLILVRIIDELK